MKDSKRQRPKDADPWSWLCMEPWPGTPERYLAGLEWVIRQVADVVAKQEAAEHAQAVETWEWEGGR